MRVVSVSVRDFRSYETAAAPLGGGLTVLWGPNGAGKTNLIEALLLRLHRPLLPNRKRP